MRSRLRYYSDLTVIGPPFANPGFRDAATNHSLTPTAFCDRLRQFRRVGKQKEGLAMKYNIISVVILVVGIVLLVLGFNEYGTFGSRASRMLGAGVSNKVLFLFITGAACTVVGLMKTLKK